MKKNGSKAHTTYLVIGLGRFGSALCEELAAGGASVIAVDRDMSKVEAFSDKVEYIACLDATNEASLERAGAKDADVAVVCIGDDHQAAIMASAVLIDLGIPKVIACASDPVEARILTKIGVHSVIRPQIAMGRRTAEILLRPWMERFTDIGDDKHIFGRINAPKAIVGRPLKDLSLPSRYGMTISAVNRGGSWEMPTATMTLEESDDILIFGDRAKLSKLLDLDDNEQTEDAAI